MLNSNFHSHPQHLTTDKSESQSNHINITPVVFSSETLRLLRDLPEADRKIIADALVAEFILNYGAPTTLSGLQNLMYYMIADGVRRSMRRYA